MYIVAIFALALLSPLPFVSPFMYDSQDAMAQEPPFGQGEDVQNPTSSTQPDSTFTGSTSESNSTDSQPISPQELTITSLTSSSNNTNSNYAIAGDVITVSFTANETIHYNASAKIHDRDAIVSILDDKLNATITVLETDADGYANFTINMSSNSGFITVTEVDLTDGPRVFVDKHIPVITINGSHLVYVTQGEVYTDLGANVHDTDPAYSHTAASNSSTLSTSTVGTFKIEYTASADGAGNEPFNKFRTVVVQSSTLTVEADYIDTETILLRFDTAIPTFYSGSPDLTSAITVDGKNVESAYIPAQIKSVSILDNSIPGLDFIVNTAGFSAVIEHIGDINQDGYEDVAVGIPYYRESYSDRGGAVVIFHLGEDGNSILNSFLIDGDTPNMPDIDTYAENQPLASTFGREIVNVGDINGDGFTDIAVGAPFAKYGADILGAVYILFLGPNGTSVLGHSIIDNTITNGPVLPKPGATFGRSIANMGDLNGDGITDIAIVAAEYQIDIPGSPQPQSVGSTFFMHLGSDGLPTKTIEMNTTTLGDQFPHFELPIDSMAWSIENMGDLNGDGYTDIIQAGVYNIREVNNLYTIFLGEGAETVVDIVAIPMHGGTLPPIPPDPNGGATRINNINFGESIAKLDDVNNDGFTDLLVAAPSYLDGNGTAGSATSVGRVFVLSLGAEGRSILGHYAIGHDTIEDFAPVNFELQKNARFGSAISVLGDINSDGALDVMIGAYRYGGVIPDVVGGLGTFDGQGALQLVSFRGPDDIVPHVVVKTNTTDTTTPALDVVLDSTAGNLVLPLIPSSVTVQTTDKIAPIISNIVSQTNTTIDIVFSENIETDTLFTTDGFRVSNTTEHVFIKNMSKLNNTSIQLEVNRISSIDEVFVEIFDSAIKDTRGNVVKYIGQTAENLVGTYPVRAFWVFDRVPISDFFPSLVVLYEGNLTQVDPYNYTINGLRAASTAVFNGYENYHQVDYIVQDSSFAFNDTGVVLTFAPKESFVDDDDDAFADNYTLTVDTAVPAKILDAETSDGGYITLTLDKSMIGVDVDDFSISDSLSVNSVNVSRNKISLNVPDLTTTNSTPTVTINGTMSDVSFDSWPHYHVFDLDSGSITATDGARPFVAVAEYDNFYNVELSYSEPINTSTISENDYEISFVLEKNFYNESIIDATTPKLITDIVVANDGLSTLLTFDRKLNSDALLRVVGVPRDNTGTAMIEHYVQLSDSRPPSMSFARTLDTSTIEITFDENINSTSVQSADFTLSDGITITGVTASHINASENVVVLHTTTFAVDATPTVTLSGAVVDIAFNPTTSHSLVVTDAIGPSLNSLSVISNNADTEFAKSADDITLTLVANEPVSFVDGNLSGITPQIVTQTNGFTATVTIGTSTSNGPSTFAITIADDAGNTKIITPSDITTGSNVIIDTLPPVIRLVGSDDTTLTIGSNYVEQGYIVIDNEPEYVSPSITPTNNIDNAQLGSYTVTYSTSEQDSAGNTPLDKTRTVTVVEPNPITITALTIASSSGDNFANTSKIITLKLETDGTDLGNFSGTLLGKQFSNTTTGGNAEFTTTVLSDDMNGNVTFSITLTNSSGNQITITNSNITDGSFVTVDTIHPLIALQGNNPDTVFKGNVYSDQGATIVDPNNPSYTGTVSANPSTLDTSSVGAQNITYTANADAAGNTPDPINRTVTVLAKPIALGALTIVSDNANTLYAKTGDTITLTLVTNGTIGSATTTIASNAITPTITDNTLVATYDVESTVTDTSSLAFTINAKNEDNLITLQLSETNLPGSGVIIDSTAPVITLIGNDPFLVYTNTSFTDPGANATDRRYATNQTISTSDTVNVNVPDTYLLEYTAPNDPAGNTGPTITRTVTVQDPPPINIDSLSFTNDDSTNNAYAKADDTLSLVLDVNYTITSFTVVALGTAISSTDITHNDDTLSIDILVPNDARESNATFAITVTNVNETTLTVTENDLSTLNIFVDTIPPTIELVGSADYYIVKDTVNPSIPNATAKDGDPNYVNSVGFSSNGTVDTSILDSIYNYTYTANSDNAGNPGPSISRIITVIDADPITITSLSITSTSSNNFANAGKEITLELETDGSNLGNFSGTLLGKQFSNTTSGGNAEFTTTVSSGDTNGNVTFSITVTNSSGNRIIITEANITDSSFVTIDTIKPVITLQGSNPDTVFKGNAYTDLGADIADSNNPSYAGTAVINPSSLDTSSVGAQNITYTGPADAAGNTPDSINRTVTVLAKPIALDTLTIASDNGVNNAYAKTGDTITLTLETNGTIGSATVTIASSTVIPTITGSRLVATYDVESTVADTNSIAFTINAKNEDNLTTVTFTEASLSGSGVIIDNTAPSIVLVGSNGSIVATNSSYTDPGATASDLSYASDRHIDGIGTIDVTTAANYTLTYTAPTDEAGNLGQIITRIVTVKDTPPINLTSLVVENEHFSNDLYATAGNTLAWAVETNYTIVSSTATLLGLPPSSVFEDGKTLYVKVVVPSDPIESYANFTITITNINGTTLTVTEDDLTSGIFIDTISPNITLDGSADYYVIKDSVDPIIPGATAGDGDPNYVNTVTLVTNGTLDTSVNGSVYIYTYTANNDTVGNLGSSINRTVTVIEADPITITSLSISSNGGNFANTGKEITLELQTEGTDLGNFSGTLLGKTFSHTTSGGNAEFTTTVSSGDTNGNVTFSITATNSSGNRIIITEANITDSSFVTIDTIKPVITLQGNNPDTVFKGNAYTDPGADIADSNNPSYVGTAVINPSSLGTSSIGDQTITYTGPADAAGNTPDAITRTVTVLAKPLAFSTLTIASNNGVNNAYAKTGDTITLTLETNGTIGSATTTIASSADQFTITGSRLVATYDVESTVADTNSLAFTINAKNEDNLTTLQLSETNLPGSGVTIDNTAPSIVLVGNNETTIATNSSYTDPGATASDSSYASDIPVTGTTDLDIARAGNYTFTYTAPVDEAGNTGPTITRVVTVADIPPITLTSVVVDNEASTNDLYATTGNILAWAVTTNDTVDSSTATLLGLPPSSSFESGNQLYVKVTVPADPVESYAEFTITIANDDGVTLTVTEDDLESGIFIDTISPTIELVGPADYNIVQNDSVTTIPNATASDGDPNYVANFTLTTNATVDTTINGSVYIFTYTANSDTVGNPGASINRTVTVIDAPKINITSLSITSTGGNFANADKVITLRLETDSDDLVNFTGTLLGKQLSSTPSGGNAEFTTTVSSGDTNGNVTFSIVATNSSGGRVSFTEGDIKDGSFVTIDTVLPVITLNGDNNTIVALGANYTDPGAAITDPNNPSYAGTVSANPTTLDTSSIGNKTITYTAPADAAGNMPDSITRIVAVEDAPPINITLFSIRNGGDSSSLYAKAGDDLTIQLSINYTIASYTATIFGIEQSESNQNSNGFLISQQVPSDLVIEEYASFSITIVDENGLPNTITQNTKITSSNMTPQNIFVDTISPTVTLKADRTSISVNDDLPIITATIIDGDPNYNYSDTSPIPESIVNASVDNTTADVYPFTYTAPNDTAGNPGQSATINIIVKDENGSTILNSSAIDGVQQSFSNSKRIEAEIHGNIINDNITLSLDAPIVELDVSSITVTSNSGTTHTTTYQHPLDLIVNNRISAQIEPDTALTFTANTSINEDNFTVQYITDDHNDGAVQLGLEGVSYTLRDHAIAITFERVSSSPSVHLRDNANVAYTEIKLYTNSTVTDSADALSIITNSSFAHFSEGAMYTHDKTARTVTLWTSHLSTAKENSTSSGGGDESDSNSPTLGKTSSGAQLVTNGFEYNGLTVNVDRYHTEFPLIGTNVGDINTISMKIYDSAGPSGIKRVEFALGVPDIGLYHEAEAFVEVWMQRDSVAVQETIIVDELNLLEDSDVSATVSQTSCSGGEQQCLLVELQYSYREPPAYNTISIKPVDWDNNAHQFYFNDGIHVDGDSINLPKEIDISASHATGTTHAGETLHLVQIDRAEHLWIDQYGYQWKIIGNTIRQITMPEYLVPDDNTYGTLHGPDRNHPEFASSVYTEQQKAQETLAEILGHATIIKPLPEHGGTIYFDATGTNSRDGETFQLLLELETARMQQLSNLLYDDIN